MELPIFQVDAFPSHVFRGNPAAVCPLEKWLSDETLQSIAAENNLAETAYFVPKNDRFHLRWFTPGCEVDLCGHATLASAYVLFRYLNQQGETIYFDTKSGELSFASGCVANLTASRVSTVSPAVSHYSRARSGRRHWRQST